MLRKRTLSLLLCVCMALCLLPVTALAAGNVVWSKNTVLAGGCDYADATIKAGVTVEIQTGMLITGTLTVEAGGKLIGKGLLYPAADTSEVVGMTLYYRVAGEYKPFKDCLKTLFDSNLWPGYAPHFEYDSAEGLWYLYVESGDFEGDPFYRDTETGGDRDLNPAMNSANRLKQLNLFQGVGTNPDGGTNFDLNRPATRVEALVMLIRLLGKEAEVTGGSFAHPFTDVPGWADKYVGYAYENGLTNGSSATTFGLGDATAQMYLTFVLRALGYSDASGGDFTWDKPEELARQAGLLDDGGISLTDFLRADAALVSEAALSAHMKSSTLLLRDKLISEGVFTQAQYDNAIFDLQTVDRQQRKRHCGVDKEHKRGTKERSLHKELMCDMVQTLSKITVKSKTNISITDGYHYVSFITADGDEYYISFEQDVFVK